MHSPRRAWHVQALALVRLGRPHFLAGGFLLYGLGAAVALYQGAAFRMLPFVLGQATITAFQLMTHYANDYFDLAADVANLTPTKFSGGSRVLPAGELPPGIAKVAALVLAFLGVCLAVLVAVFPAGAGQPVASVILLAAGALAWAYSAPPFVLHSRGWGELTTAVVVTGLTPLAGYWLQAHSGWAGATSVSGAPKVAQMTPLLLLLAVLPLGMLQFNMLLTIELPDATGDASVGKRTLVVRLGKATAARLSALALTVVFGSPPLLVLVGLPVEVMFGLELWLPLAAWQMWCLRQGDGEVPERWGRLAFRAVALLVGAAACELIAFVVLVNTSPRPR